MVPNDIAQYTKGRGNAQYWEPNQYPTSGEYGRLVFTSTIKLLLLPLLTKPNPSHYIFDAFHESIEESKNKTQITIEWVYYQSEDGYIAPFSLC